MPFETVHLRVNGRKLPHTECTLNCGAEEVERDASFSVAWNGAGLPCETQEPATVHIGSELWLTGEVRDINPAHDAESRTYQINLISATCDASECSVVHPTGLVKNADMMAVAKAFDTLGIGVEGDVQTEIKRVHKLRQGETLIDTLETEASNQGVLIHDTPEGKLKLADKPEGRHAGTLKRGVNIKSATGALSSAGSFSEVTGKGQNSHGTNSTSMRPTATVKNAGVKRRRPLIKIYEGETTEPKLKKRVEWENKRTEGNNTSATLVTPGWRDAAGKVWDRNFLVSVDDDWIAIEQDMVTATVSLHQGDDGTYASLGVKDPPALGGKNAKGKSAKSWAAPGEAQADYREEEA